MCIWNVLVRCKRELEGLTRFLHEVHQLLHFEKSDEGLQEPLLVPVYEPNDYGASRRQPRAGGPMRHNFRRGRTSWSEAVHMDVWQRIKCAPDQWLHISPIQPAIAAAQRWHGNRPNLPLVNHLHEVFQTRLNVLDLALGLPV